MDPLSVTSSIIAVLQVTTEVMSYLNDIKNASEEQRQITKEASNLYVFLHDIKYRVESASDNEPWYDHARSLSREGGPLDELGDVVENIAEKTRKTKRFKWKFAKEEVKKFLDQIERLKSLISASLDDDHLYVPTVYPYLAAYYESADVRSTLSKSIKSDVSIVKEGMEKLMSEHEGRLARHY